MCDYYLCRLRGKCVFEITEEKAEQERPLHAQPDENPYVE